MQVQELAQLQQQLYEELSRTPEQGAAFTDVVKTVLERETAFVKWKSEGASPYWDVTGSGPDNTASCEPCSRRCNFASMFKTTFVHVAPVLTFQSMPPCTYH